MPSDMVTSKENLDKDLMYLSENGYTAISLSDLQKHYKNPKHRLPRKPVIITFDDGYEDNYTHAFPLLKKYETRALMFPIVWSVGRDKFVLNDDPINPHFAWGHAKEMLQSGLIDIGSHTFDMHSPEGLSYGYGKSCGCGLGMIPEENEEDYIKRITSDLEMSKRLIEKNIGQEIVCFSYPYGIHNEQIIEAAKNVGFELGFITEAEEFCTCPYKIRRFSITDDLRISDILASDQ